MKHAPLKRHDSLQPLSRDHYAGLVQARRVTIAADKDASQRLASLSEFVDEWDSIMNVHFNDEEHLLLHLIGDTTLANRLLDEHDRIRELATQARYLVERLEAPDSQWLRSLGKMLHDHIRWEERTLFPAIENNADPSQLAALKKDTIAIENRRPRWERAKCRIPRTQARKSQ